MKTVTVHGHVCTVEHGKYANGQNRIQLWCDEGPYATASVAIDAHLSEDEVAIKDYSENRGVWDALLNAAIIEDTGKRFRQGFVEIPVGRLL